MLAIKFIDSPVDLGPCHPTISNQGPGGPDQATDSLLKKLPNAPGLGQESNLLIIGETIQNVPNPVQSGSSKRARS